MNILYRLGHPRDTRGTPAGHSTRARHGASCLSGDPRPPHFIPTTRFDLDHCQLVLPFLAHATNRRLPRCPVRVIFLARHTTAVRTCSSRHPTYLSCAVPHFRTPPAKCQDTSGICAVTFSRKALGCLDTAGH